MVLTPEQRAKKNARQRAYYHRNKYKFTAEQKERRRQNSLNYVKKNYDKYIAYTIAYNKRNRDRICAYLKARYYNKRKLITDLSKKEKKKYNFNQTSLQENLVNTTKATGTVVNRQIIIEW